MVRKAHHRLTTPKKAPSILTSILVTGGLVTGAVVAVPALAATAAPITYTAGKTLVSDDFSRTLGASWGSAPVGGAYKASSPSSFAAAGGEGVMALPRPGTSLSASLPAVSAADVN